MKLTFLGTGTSFGVPVVGCDCPTCTSDDPRDRRTRHGALIDLPGGRLLVDTPPELRLQLLAAGVESVDALWLTHDHADHVHGIDDIRAFTARGKDLPTWTAPEYEASLHERFRYIFDEAVQPPLGSSKPRIVLNTFKANKPVTILGEEFVPVRVPHGGPMVYGFRVGKLGYVTDAKTLPVMVASQTGSQGINWWAMAALSCAAILPLVIIGIVLERYIIKGMAAGAVK